MEVLHSSERKLFIIEISRKVIILVISAEEKLVQGVSVIATVAYFNT